MTTNAYSKQLHDADALVEKTIEENLPAARRS